MAEKFDFVPYTLVKTARIGAVHPRKNSSSYS